MKVLISNVKTGLKEVAIISILKKSEIPMKKNGWNFNWKKLYLVEGSITYKLSLQDSLGIVEGLIMLTIINGEMVYMNNVELAPHNLGSNRAYNNVAGCLMAFACRESFEKGKNEYKGFLSFDSKTELIDLYQKKYGATHAMGQKLFFDPNAGKVMIQKYLQL